MLLMLGFAVSADGQGTDAAKYPSRPITFIVPTPAGSEADLPCRLIAKEAEKFLGQPIVVENRAGAGGNIGAEMVAKAAPDGYTLLCTSNALALSPALYRKLPYDAAKDFVPVVQFSSSYQVLTVNPKVPARTVKEFIDYAKKNPGKLNLGAINPGSTQNLSAHLFKQVTGVAMQHVPYKGSSPAMVDLLRDLQKRRDLTYMFISHDLRVVAALASRLLVLRNGKMVEEGAAAELFKAPKTDYTRALFAAAFKLETAPEGIVSQ